MDLAPAFTLVEPGPELADGIARVHNDSWREAYQQLVPSEFYDEEALQRRRRTWHALLTDPDPAQRIRCALDPDGSPIGFATAGPARDTASPVSKLGSNSGPHPPRERELYSIYLRAAWYGSGAAQELLDEVLQGSRAMVWVLADNPRAQAFYRRNGFELDGTEQILDRLGGLIEVRMVR